ncbi:hypothetical protein PPACK8108_LOCUS8623, partial [Phakopsora pachyrhizi]
MAIFEGAAVNLGKGGAESAPGGCKEEGVAVKENGWCHWKEGQKLGGGAHQGQSGWSKLQELRTCKGFLEVDWIR